MSGTSKRTTAWLRWPAGLALCLPFLVLASLARATVFVGSALTSWAEALADLIDELTTD